MLQDELNKNPFTVPDNYFDKLPSRVQEMCINENKSKTLWSVIKPRLAYVGGFGALAMLAYGGFSLTGNQPEINQGFAETEKVKPVSASSFLNNNAKSYAQFTNTNPFIQVLENNHSEPAFNVMDEDIINYLAIENISVDDILDFAY